MGCHDLEVDKDLGEFIFACHRAHAYGLVRYSSGNMSWRLNDELVAITAAGAWLGELERADITICRLADSEGINGKACSAESGFHLGILRERPEVNVVLHFQSPAATAMACSDLEHVDFNVIIEVPYYIGAIGVVDYLPAGSRQWAEAVTTAMKDNDLALLHDHGQVVVGKDFDSTLQKAGFFELACEIHLKGKNLRTLSPQATYDLQS